MKNLFTLFSALFFTSVLFSQITINSNNVATIGTEVTQATDTMVAGSTQPGGTGNQTWNFTGLNAHVLSNLSFVAASEAPYYADFPNADIGVVQDSNFISFITKDNNSMELVGAVTVVTDGTDSLVLKLKYTNPQTLIEFPAAYGGSFDDESAQSLTIAGALLGLQFDSVELANRTERSTIIDAFGSLSTPLGTFSVLRMNTTSISYDTSSVLFLGIWQQIGASIDTSTSYTWWTNAGGLGYPLVTMSIDNETSTVTSVTWLQATSVSNEEVQANNTMNIYPNPAADFLVVEAPGFVGGTIELYDFNGRKVSVENAAEKTTLSLRGLARGAYVAVLKNAKGGLSGFQKFEIVR